MTVAAPEGALGSAILEVAPEPNPAGDTALFVGPVVRISAGAEQPRRPVTIDFPLPNLRQPAHIAYLDEPTGWWIPVETRTDPASGSLSATVDHLSVWTVLSDKIVQGAQGVASALEYQAFRVLGNRGDKPQCVGKTPSWVQTVITSDSENAQLLSCAESAGDDLALKVVNNRGYPVTVEFTTAYRSASTSLPNSLGELVQRAGNIGSTAANTRLFLTGRAAATVTFARPGGVAGTVQGHARHDTGTFLTNAVFQLASAAGADIPIGGGKTLGISTVECMASVVGTGGAAGKVIREGDGAAASGTAAELRGCAGNVVQGELARAGAGTPQYGRLQVAARMLKAMDLFSLEQQVLDFLLNDSTPEAALVDVSFGYRGTAAQSIDGTTDLKALWKRWQALNDICRGGSGGDPATGNACTERDQAMKEHFEGSKNAFLVAWRQRDNAGLIARTHSGNAVTALKIPADLLGYTPTEKQFSDCKYDVKNSAEVGCYMAVKELGTSLYFQWETEYDHGWRVRSFAPDV
ncbi:hypothetical protein [Amycolatopsis sp. WAC 01376]|uniref:hypothetical protein n=1 Tax=Amycolatopsis sp. WAC 01376 TaxID=2203195 RepID=UPI000F77C6AA|nr:hypothetical protein [Amycolatopsis sp. WAC 01376]